VKDKFDRLVRIMKSDGGFYVLATHSFIEYFMKANFPEYDDSWAITFNTNLYNYKMFLIKKKPGFFLNELTAFKSIMDQTKMIKDVRHNFATLSIEEVRAATFNLIQFCKVVGLFDTLPDELKSSLSLWKKKAETAVDAGELQIIKRELYQLKQENNELLEQYREFEKIKSVKKLLEAQIESLSCEIDVFKHNKNELLSKQLDLKNEKIEIEKKINEYKTVDKYLKNLLRVTVYTRTRMDYERSLTELTSEQKDILKNISLKSDFLIKGGAGTGKTLVLLEAMKAANAGTLDFANKKLLLLTYTNTLVKYDRYISEIMDITDGDSFINTSDSYLNSIFEEYFPELKIDYTIMQTLCKEQNVSDFFDEKQLRVEIEDFIYGNHISETEYLIDKILRKGMKSPISMAQREEIWLIKRDIEKLMVKNKTISKGFSRTMLFDKLSDNNNNLKHDYDHIFIDESQDLYPVELQILKIMSKSSLVMAGDTDQSIYGIGSPYQRAQISTIGSTRILKMNFRNTIPIHNLAENFRKISGYDFDSSITPTAFREGPIPEIYTATNTSDLYDLLVEKVKVFINTIEYDPENICILAPTATFLWKIKDRLEKEGFSTINIKDPEFSFKSEGSIRLSPLHSSKGLDIPVVLLFLPILFFNKEIGKDDGETLVRNLIYVSMTRAMDNLNIFMKEEPDNKILMDLKEVSHVIN
jgi:hypothetical protein